MVGHRARKRFGQNFLVDAHYVARIIAAIDPRPGDNVVEIGPGLGALTRSLITSAGRIHAIEIDRDLATRLLAAFPADHLALHVADALAFDYASLGEGLRVVGNLPYNISTPLLFHLAGFHARLRDLTLMLQREVVERIVAQAAAKAYGRLTVMLQARFAAERLFTVPSGAFRPVPQVESAVVRLVPLGAAAPRIHDEALFARIVSAAFGQRRKTLRNALATLCDETLLGCAGVNPQARGETLAVADFVRLANALAATNKSVAK